MSHDRSCLPGVTFPVRSVCAVISCNKTKQADTQGELHVPQEVHIMHKGFTLYLSPFAKIARGKINYNRRDSGKGKTVVL